MVSVICCTCQSTSLVALCDTLLIVDGQMILGVMIAEGNKRNWASRGVDCYTSIR
jgi:hypothetical protein